MKRILVVAAMLVLMAGVVGGTLAWAKASDNATEAPLPIHGKGIRAVDASYSGQEVELAVGWSLTVTLESNPSTGFQWQLASNMGEAVLELADHEYEPSEAPAGFCGAGGQEVRTFKALQKGKSTITMEYSQPWEGGTKAAETFVVNVVVK